MSLLRSSSLKQLKRLRKQVGKDIGDKTTKSSKIPNVTWIGNPMDKKVDTYEDNYSVGNAESLGKTKIKKLKEHTNMKENLNNAYDKQTLPNMNKGTIIKKYSDMETYNDVLRRGQHIKTKDVEGYIERVSDSNVYIQPTDGSCETIKIPLSKFAKGLPKDKKMYESASFNDVEYICKEMQLHLDEFVNCIEELETNISIGVYADNEEGNDLIKTLKSDLSVLNETLNFFKATFE